MKHLPLRNPSTRRPRIAASVLIALCATTGIYLAAGAAAPAGSRGPDRLHRQVGVMEGIFDKILLESPNFVVSGRQYTRGVVLPDYGVVFSFNASMNDNGVGFSGLSSLGPLDLRVDDNGTVVIHRNGRSSGSEDEDSLDTEVEQATKMAQREKERAAELKQKSKRLRDRAIDLRGWEKEQTESSRTLYTAGKKELVQALLDYGETPSELKAGEWIVLAGFSAQNSFLRDKKVSRLVLRAKIDDLRAFSTGRISESEAEARVIAEEY
jgi:hypothetical protein